MNKDEIKQAVREVLLSEEFLLAFGKAIANAPIPSSIQYDSFAIASEYKSSEVTSSYSIPDGWRELEPKEIPKRGGMFWHNGKWHELLADGTVAYECYKQKHICKIDPPKPAFAVGDKVKFCGADNYHWLNGKIGLVTLIEENRFYVTRPDGYGWFDPSELQPVEASK